MTESGKDHPTRQVKHTTASIIKMIMDLIHCMSGTTEFLPQDILKENES